MIKGLYMFGFHNVVVGCINRMATLMEIFYNKKMYLHFTETTKGAVIARLPY